MRILPLLFLALALGACGDAPAPTDPGAGPSSTDAPSGGTATALTPRDKPLAKGEKAPAFSALPDGTSVLVFYRGKW